LLAANYEIDRSIDRSTYINYRMDDGEDDDRGEGGDGGDDERGQRRVPRASSPAAAIRRRHVAPHAHARARPRVAGETEAEWRVAAGGRQQ